MEIQRERPDSVIFSAKYLCCIISTCGFAIYFFSFYSFFERSLHLSDFQENFDHFKHQMFYDGSNPTALVSRKTGSSSMLAIQETLNTMQNRIDYLEKINFGKIGRTDYASVRLGGEIVSIEPSHWWYGVLSRLESRLGIGIFARKNRNCCIVEDECQGRSKAFHGDSAIITLKLMDSIFIENITIEHMPLRVIPDHAGKSALKFFSVWGLQHSTDTKNQFYFGKFIFNVELDFLQTFNITRRSSNPHQYVKIVVESNHGASYTCIYRIRVHGTIATSLHKNFGTY
ncbi:sperm-associated antigen 4 protein [Uranotaenia lowii]|uniref:sperm-associated antigen 4 protein n=1 Tax=Uranotaenia lowii TaxID=190385 RepID=UPI00247A2212|nr:sperm-associated antigen 4 protein [Uranotaenia lowii]